MDTETINLTDPAFLADPAPVLDRVRTAGPLARIKLPFFGPVWFTTDDAGARDLLKSPELFCRDPATVTGRSMAQTFWWIPASMRPLTRSLVVRDDPEHKRLRGLVERAFARHSIEAMRPALVALAHRLLDRLPTDRAVDLVASYTRQFPFEVISELLGVSPKRREELRVRISPISSVGSAAGMMLSLFRLRGAVRLIRSEIAEAKAGHRAGLLAQLVEPDETGARLEDDDLLAMVSMLFIAGHETTVHLLNGAIHAMISDTALRTLPAPNMPILVEEFLRFLSPVMMTKPMVVTRDLVWRGVPLRKGDKIVAGLIAANYDPARHASPREMQPDRRPNAHLTFGHGPHVCLGMPLARAEAEIALTSLFARFPHCVIDPSNGPLRYRRRIGIRAPDRLWVRLRP